MPRTRNLIRACKDCGIVESSTVYLSARGVCLPCGMERMVAAIKSIREKKGEVYERWRAGLARSLDGKGED